VEQCQFALGVIEDADQLAVVRKEPIALNADATLRGEGVAHLLLHDIGQGLRDAGAQLDAALVVEGEVGARGLGQDNGGDYKLEDSTLHFSWPSAGILLQWSQHRPF
jgi:hypothetical protein